MLGITNGFEIFGRKVIFTIEEIAHYMKVYDLEISNGDILEFFLMSDGVFSFPDDISDQEIHNLCEKAIVSYIESLRACIECCRREGFFDNH